MRAIAVIGGSLGDEAKGLLVDYYGSQLSNPIIIRFNGGSQAGHTVCAPDGRRHVFSHFGAGSFLGAPTFLSKHFIVNPSLYVKELAELRGKGVTPKVLTDERAIVSLPLDGMVNQIAEACRGDERHGSCGVGVNECIERSKLHRLTMANVFSYKKRAENIAYALFRLTQTSWLPARLAQLNLTLNEQAQCLLNIARSPTLFEQWLQEFRAFREHIEPYTALPKDASIVFEGAQGLLLDQNNSAWFPHLTRSNTGLTNVHELALENGITGLDVTYVTRCYLTRHGAGPLPHELDKPPYSGIIDETNRPNPHQGALRFAHLDLDLLKSSIQFDLTRTNLPVTATVAVTCLDQTDHVMAWEDGVLQTYYKTHEFPEIVKEYVGVDKAIGVYGPTRHDVGSLALA